MSRIPTPDVQSATGATAEIYAQIRKAAGGVPNTFAVIGALEPAALKAMLQADSVLVASTLSKQDQEAIKLTVSEVSGCDYCMAAHTLLGKLAGLKADALKRIRIGQATGDAKRDALVQFVSMLVNTHGTIGDEDFAAIFEHAIVDRSADHVRRVAGRQESPPSGRACRRGRRFSRPC